MGFCQALRILTTKLAAFHFQSRSFLLHITVQAEARLGADSNRVFDVFIS